MLSQTSKNSSINASNKVLNFSFNSILYTYTSFFLLFLFLLKFNIILCVSISSFVFWFFHPITTFIFGCNKKIFNIRNKIPKWAFFMFFQFWKTYYIDIVPCYVEFTTSELPKNVVCDLLSSFFFHIVSNQFLCKFFHSLFIQQINFFCWHKTFSFRPYHNTTNIYMTRLIICHLKSATKN